MPAVCAGGLPVARLHNGNFAVRRSDGVAVFRMQPGSAKV